MKPAVPCLAVLLLASLIGGGCRSNPASPPPARISDAYAKAALKALDMIAVHATNPGMQAQIVDALLNVDAEAVSNQESELRNKLNSLYRQALANESVRQSFVKANQKKNTDRAAAALNSCTDKFLQETRHIFGQPGLGEAGLREADCERHARPPDEQSEEYRVRHSDPHILEIDRREVGCYKLFANALRNRSAVAPKECDSLSTEIVAPAAGKERTSLP